VEEILFKFTKLELGYIREMDDDSIRIDIQK